MSSNDHLATLRAQVSTRTKVEDWSPSTLPRWSDFGSPSAACVVRIGAEEDAAAVVKYCDAHDVPFLVSNGANGIGDTFDLGNDGIIIDLSPLNDITIHPDGTSATIQAGVTAKQLVETGKKNAPPVRFAVPTCNTLGWLGVALGGGLPRTLGHDGFLCDQVLSARVILASGETVLASPDTHPDLFWAIRGAGPNFGIVISAHIKCHPTPGGSGSMAYQGIITFTEEGYEKLADAVDRLEFSKHMNIDFQFVTAGNPLSEIECSAVAFYYIFPGEQATVQDAERAFEPVISVAEPRQGNFRLVPNDVWNEFSDPLCTRGGRKPAWTVTTNRLQGKALRRCLERAKELRNEYSGKGLNLIWMQAQNYPVEESPQENRGSYPWRGVKTHIPMLLGYEDKSFDKVAERWGSEVRNILRESSGETKPGAYINFAYGDETPEMIYGESLEKLRQIKKDYDPKNRFNQWFPVIPRQRS